MGRAFLVVNEMPDNCRHCYLNYDMVACVGVSCDSDKPARNTFLESDDERPEWCPLKEFPEFKKPNDEFPDDTDIAFVAGWNYCLEKILE